MAREKSDRGNILSSDPITVGGVFVSLLVSVGLVVFDVTDGILGFIIGLLMTTLTLLVQHMYDSKARSELDLALRRSRWLRHNVTDLARKTGDLVEMYERNDITKEAEARFVALTREIDALSRGTIERAGGDYRDLLSATASVKNTIQAITNISQRSDIDTEQWWAGPIGRTYWEANLDAMARGVSISRIFIYAQMTDSLAELLETQRKAGVDVRLLLSSAVDPSKHINITLWDAERAWEAKMNAHGAIVNNLYHLHEHEVNRLVADFATCRSFSQPFNLPV